MGIEKVYADLQAAVVLRERGKRAVEDASPYAAATERRDVGGGVPDAPDGYAAATERQAVGGGVPDAPSGTQKVLGGEE